jgi:hypothetical protein
MLCAPKPVVQSYNLIVYSCWVALTPTISGGSSSSSGHVDSPFVSVVLCAPKPGFLRSYNPTLYSCWGALTPTISGGSSSSSGRVDSPFIPLLIFLTTPSLLLMLRSRKIRILTKDKSGRILRKLFYFKVLTQRLSVRCHITGELSYVRQIMLKLTAFWAKLFTHTPITFLILY